MEVASDLADRQGPIYKEDTAIFVSQSGETADTLQALDDALENGALCVGITHIVGSALARKTHCGVHINAGCEIGVASTKAYTSQIVVMAMLALAVGGDMISNEARREAIIDGLLDLSSKVKEVLKLDEEMKDLAELLINEQSLLVFGRGYNYATALEGSLKVKEVALMHNEGILAGEMKHGPLALVDHNLPIVVIATRDACFSKQQSVIQQLHARKGRLIVMCTKGDSASVSVGGSCRVIEVPRVEDCLQPVLNVIPLQELLGTELLNYLITISTLRAALILSPRTMKSLQALQVFDFYLSGQCGLWRLISFAQMIYLAVRKAPVTLLGPPVQLVSLVFTDCISVWFECYRCLLFTAWLFTAWLETLK
nr:glutamine--fructose-6-phosphate aminotransferase [isomerizing]-like [Coffea arabica]